MTNSLWLNRTIAALLVFALILTAVFTWPLTEAGKDQKSHGAEPTSVDFVKKFYGSDGITDDHVFDSVTLERLVRTLRVSDKKSVVVFGSPLNATTKATLKYIDEVAAEYGIEKIYLFDPHIGYDPENPEIAPLDIFDTTKLYGDAYKSILVPETVSATNGSLLKYANPDYSSDDTYLFVYDRKANADDPNVITASLLIEGTSLPITDTAALKLNIENVFTTGGLTDGAPDETRLGQFDFFRSWTGGTALVTDAHQEGFRIQSITYPELLSLLTEPGKQTIVNVGSWCPDSKAAIGLISENATAYSASVVYAFDFRLDGGLAPSVTIGGLARSSGNLSITSTNGNPATTTGVNAYKNDQWGTRYLGGNLIKKLAPYESGLNQTVWYHANGIPSDPTNLADGTVESVQKKFRSPFLIQWDKDRSPKVVQNWLHQLSAFEQPWHSGAADSSSGDFIDAELSSGTLTNPQKEQLRADLGTFFSGQPPYSSAPRQASAIVIPSSKGGNDSGCGDDNDPIDNLNQTTLIPYSGTDEFDVLNYDISIAFDPAGPEQGQFTGKTILRATAAKSLNTILLDLRDLNVTGVQVRNLTTAAGIPSTFQQENQDEKDLHKLSVNLGSNAIAAGNSFQVTVDYTTGLLDNFVAASQSTQGFSKTRHGTGGVAIGEPFGSTYWFPNNNTPADGALYKISLSYPSTGGYLGVSNGKNTATSTSGSTTTKVWEVNQETAPYQIFAAFSDDYRELPQTVTLSSGKELSGLSYVSKTIYTENQNRNRDKIGTFYNRLPQYIQNLEAIAGPYPGDSIGFVFDDLSNGSGSSAQWGAVETKDRPFYTSNGITSENTFIHEFAHQWYGNAVRIKDWKSLWLNEGFATYVTDLYYERSRNDFDSVAKWKAVYDREGPASLLWEAAPADILLESDLFGDAKSAYNRGALALAALRVSIGDDDFFRILKAWPSAKKGQAVNTKDFIAFAEEAANVNLTAFANTWLYGKTKPAAFPTARLPEGRDPEQEKPDPDQNKKSVDAVSLTAAARILAPGKTLALNAAVSPADAADKGLVWSSSNGKIASVDSAGLVKGIAEGTVTITAKARDGSGKSGSILLTVAKPVTAVRTPLKTVYLKKGAALIPPVAADNGASTAAKVTWKSSNTSIATVSSTGKITAKKTGKTTITATTLNGKKTTFTLFVVAKALAVKKIGVTGVGKTLKKGKTAQLKIKLTPAKTTDRNVTFSSSKPSVLKVDKAGRIKAVKKGTAVVKIKVGKKTVKKTITVK